MFFGEMEMNDIPDIAKRVRRRHLTYLSAPKFRSLFAEIARVKVEGVAGDFVEFGVALGGSAICIASQLDDNRNFHGFDVFGMIPPPGEMDGAEPHARYDVIKSGRSTGIGGETYYGYNRDLLETVKSNFAAFNLPVDGNRIRFVRGLYEKTLSGRAGFPIAFAHIDCDWYESVRICLNHLNENLSPGGAAVLDDYNDWDGCKTAVDEFCSSRTEFVMVRSKPHAVIVRAVPS